ncbi:hypothetical protein CLHOM_34700 [Clostridium homopropionicum DSM 5847]|uniref:ABC-transporter type IV n=1 Tax=Clostridium homopropionicum DSM 5847 TaxID=1121318 RepID=A0A0L6Z6U9_9CLOT|nr:hypothetical protein [Clostridium homopropionicum]KOA18568.1 hypothetical protein CLHOM_34700 [Clostridium homopropionicum DSM 5847]
MGKRFIIYGFAGLCMEVFFVGFLSLLKGDFNMVGHTSIWMFPVYGSAVLLEYVHEYLRPFSIIVRGGIYTLLIFMAEFFSGWIFQNVLGVYPWDYTGSPFSVYGLIRLDYAPAWFLVGLIFEKLHDRLISAELLRD